MQKNWRKWPERAWVKVGLPTRISKPLLKQCNNEEKMFPTWLYQNVLNRHQPDWILRTDFSDKIFKDDRMHESRSCKNKNYDFVWIILMEDEWVIIYHCQSGYLYIKMDYYWREGMLTVLLIIMSCGAKWCIHKPSMWELQQTVSELDDIDKQSIG